MGILDFFEKYPIPGKIIGFFVDVFCRLNRLFFSGFSTGRNNILIVSLHRLGDTVFTIPAVKALHKVHGQNIVVACFSDAAEIYKLAFPNLRYVIIEKSEFKFGGRIASTSAREKIRAILPLTVYDITGSIFSASMLCGVKTGSMYGVTTGYFKNLYTKYVIQRTTPHLIDLYFDIVTLAFPAMDVRNFREFEPKPVISGPILIHPFAGWKAKEWNIDKILKLLNDLSSEYDSALICEAGKLDAESAGFINKNGLKLIETKSIHELIENIKNCSMFIGSDSGPLYIAALLGKPTFCIYSATNPDYSFQFGPNYRYIIKQLHCSPKPGNQYCHTKGGVFGCPSFECMNRLEYEEVKEKLKLFIKELKIKEKIT